MKKNWPIKRFIRGFLQFFALLFFSLEAFPQNPEIAAIRPFYTSFAVFPIYGHDTKKAEEAWWQVRDLLTKGPSFFVASRRLMVNRGVFDPRKEMKPADSIILGKILEAQVIINMSVIARNFTMEVIETESGTVLWKSSREFKPVLPIDDQIEKMATSMVERFMLDFPYQSYQITNPNSASSVTESEGKTYATIAKIQGRNVQLMEVGDPVLWIEIIPKDRSPLFQGGSQISIIAEGTISHLDENTAEVEIVRMRSLEDFKQNAIVRLPRAIEILKSQSEDTADYTASLSNEYLAAEIRPVQEFKVNHHSTAASLSWIASLATFILLAF